MAWRCNNCGMQNTVDGYPCLRCEHYQDGRKPRDFTKAQIRTNWALRSFVTLAVFLVASSTLAYIFVAKTQGRAATKSSCAESGTRYAYSNEGIDEDGPSIDPETGEFSDIPQDNVAFRLGIPKDQQKTLSKSDLANMFVNSGDSAIQQPKDLRQALGILTRADVGESAAVSWGVNGNTVVVINTASSGCAEQLNNELTAMLGSTAKRLAGTTEVVSRPGGAVLTTYRRDGRNDTRRLVVTKAGIVVLVDGANASGVQDAASTVTEATFG